VSEGTTTGRGSSSPGEPGAGGRDGEEGPRDLPNLGVRVLKLFVSPGELFEDLRENPAWLGALLLAVALGFLVIFLIPEEIYRSFLMEQAPPDVPADALEQQLDMQMGFRFVGPALFIPLGGVITAGILLFLYNLILGGDGSFRQLFAATSHALIIPQVGGLLTVPLQIGTGEFETSLGLHLLAPGLDPGFLQFFLQGLNVFVLWSAVVLGIAVSRIYRRQSAGSAVTVVVGMYVAFALAGAAVRAALTG
jgi:hypothetical protein